MPQRLFVYGTLRPGHAPAEIAATVDALAPLGDAAVYGRLYRLGDAGRPYPGIVLDEEAPEVAGTVLLLPDDPGVLLRLDAYEDFRPDDPAGSLFCRRQTTVTLRSGERQECWVYVYNGPLPGRA